MDPPCALEMPAGGNTAEEVERGVSLENQQKPLKYVPFICKPFPVWKIAYKVHKTALWQPSKILSGVDSCCKLLDSKRRVVNSCDEASVAIVLFMETEIYCTCSLLMYYQLPSFLFVESK